MRNPNYHPGWGDINGDDGKFILLEGEDENIKLSDRPLKLLDVFIRQTIGPCKKIKALRNGSILVQTINDKDAIKVNGKNFTVGVEPNAFKIKIGLHQKMNQSKGTFYSNRIMKEDPADIKDLLKEYDVTEVYRVTKKVDDKILPTPLHIVTFNRQHPPEEVNICFEFLKVRTYYQKPLRCYRCQHFNHPTKYCDEKNPENCSVCSLEKKEAHQCGPKMCLNCEEIPDLKKYANNHSPIDRNCPRWAREVQIKKIQTDLNLDYRSAVAEFRRRMPPTQMEQKTMAEAVKEAVANELASMKLEISKLKEEMGLKDKIIERLKATIKANNIPTVTVKDTKTATPSNSRQEPMETEFTKSSIPRRLEDSEAGKPAKRGKTQTSETTEQNNDLFSDYEVVTPNNYKTMLPKSKHVEFLKKANEHYVTHKGKGEIHWYKDSRHLELIGAFEEDPLT